MWGDLSPERFQNFKQVVEDNQQLIGSLLCALAVKMNNWTERFPDPKFGAPMQRADYIINDMAQGLELH